MRNLKRVLSLALALVMVLGLMVIGASAASADFPDAEEINYTEAVDVISGLGIMIGDEKDNFNPTDILTREQAAKIMAYIMLGEKNAEKLGSNTQIFDDVAAGRWSAGYIAYCTNVGILAGYGNGNFGPEDKLTGVAFAKMLLTAAGYDAEVEGYVGTDWATNIAVDAIEAGIDIKGVILADELTREQAAQMVLQALEINTVEYVKGNVIGLIGPYTVGSDNTVDYDGTADDVQQFCEKYFPDLEKTAGTADNWGRPADHAWEYDGDVIAKVMKTPVKTYTTTVTECDIAEDLKLKSDTTVSKLTINGVDATADAADYFNGDNKINVLATKKTVGEQGRLTEIYKVGTRYQVVMIDTFLAKVTDVTEVEYDRNGHISEKATLTLNVFVKYGAGVTEVELTANKDWKYSKGDMLLIYAETDDHDSVDVETSAADQYVEILGIADSMVGAQTAYTNKNDTHIVEDKEYSDSYQFNLDEAVNKTSDYTWYFDTYGNLIGAAEIAAQTNYGVISSIYWKDSRDGENGYAWANITYMDGTSDTVKVWKIAGNELEGVEGKGADYTKGWVSSTKQYNAAEFVNVALYKITEGKNGLILTETTKLSEDAYVTTGVPNIDTGANATKSTLFLVWNGKTYETYTGIKNVPSYKAGADGSYWAANLSATDITAEYVFIKADAIDAQQQITFYAHSEDRLTIKSYLKSGIEYYSITGGYVNGEPNSILVKAGAEDNYTGNATVMEILDNQGTLLILDLKNTYVNEVTVVTDHAEYLAKDKVYAVYAGDAADASLSSDGSVLYADGISYYVDDAETLSYNGRSLSKNIKDDTGYLYVVYTMSGKTKTAQYVIISDVPGTAYVAPITPAENNLYSVTVKGVAATATGEGTGTAADPIAYVVDADLDDAGDWLKVVAVSRDAQVNIHYGSFANPAMFTGTGEAVDTTAGAVPAGAQWFVEVDGVYYVVTPYDSTAALLSVGEYASPWATYSSGEWYTAHMTFDPAVVDYNDIATVEFTLKSGSTVVATVTYNEAQVDAYVAAYSSYWTASPYTWEVYIPGYLVADYLLQTTIVGETETITRPADFQPSIYPDLDVSVVVTMDNGTVYSLSE